jgi:hypothetical protein
MKKQERKQEIFILLTLVLFSVLGGMMYFGNTLLDSHAHMQLYYTIEQQELIEFFDADISILGVLTRPIAVLPVFLFTPFLDIFSAWATMNLILYILSSILLYYTLKRFFDTRVAFIAGILFAVSLPTIVWGTRILSEIHGYFFALLGIYLIELLLKKDKASSYLIISLYLCFATLIRENVFVLYPYLALTILYKNKFNIMGYIKNIWKYFILALSLLSSQIWTFFLTGKSIVGNRMNHYMPNRFTLSGLMTIVPRTIITFHIGWFYFLIGLFAKKTKAQKEFYVKVLLSAGLFVAISYTNSLYSPRSVFMLFPAVLAASAVGIIVLSNKCSKYCLKPSTWTIILVLFYALLSFVGAFLYPESTDVGLGGISAAVWNELIWKLGI